MRWVLILFWTLSYLTWAHTAKSKNVSADERRNSCAFHWKTLAVETSMCDGCSFTVWLCICDGMVTSWSRSSWFSASTLLSTFHHYSTLVHTRDPSWGFIFVIFFVRFICLTHGVVIEWSVKLGSVVLCSFVRRNNWWCQKVTDKNRRSKFENLKSFPTENVQRHDWNYLFWSR